MADMQHLNLCVLLKDTVYNTIYVWPIAVKQMSQILAFRCSRASVRLFFQGQNRLL